MNHPYALNAFENNILSELTGSWNKGDYVIE